MKYSLMLQKELLISFFCGVLPITGTNVRDVLPKCETRIFHNSLLDVLVLATVGTVEAVEFSNIVLVTFDTPCKSGAVPDLQTGRWADSRKA